MQRMPFILASVFLAASVASAQTPASSSASSSVPAAVHSQADCSGFIAKTALPRDLVVTGGGDNSERSVVREFVEGDTIFVAQQKGTSTAVGAEYNVVRPANELFRTVHYTGQRSDIRKSGIPYENVGRVRVIPQNSGRVVGQVESSSGNVMITHAGMTLILAEVTFSCASISQGDILVPFQPSAIPEYTVSKPLDPFAPLDSSKLKGRITASHDNYGFLGAEMVVYLNLGKTQGVKPGQRFRIYKALPPHPTGWLTIQPVPPETIGEAVVLSVQSNSCTAMVVSSYRQISAGDHVEAE